MKRRYLVDLAIARARPAPSSINSVASEGDIVAQAAQPQAKRQYVDFNFVPPGHWAMHDRLQNWARWSRGTPGRIERAAPMFALYKSSDARRTYGEDTSVPVDQRDATKVAAGVSMLGEKHRRAIHWAYLHPYNPKEAASSLGLSMQSLADYIREARQMLINRMV